MKKFTSMKSNLKKAENFIINRYNFNMTTKNIQKILPILFLFIFCISSCVARQGVYKGTEYTFQVSYSDKICPGDIVFINMKFSGNANYEFSLPEKATMNLVRRSNGKDYGTVELYTVRQNPPILFATIPTSSYLETGELTVIIEYSDNNNQMMTFELPVTVNEKNFIEEVLHLNATNTAIKTDNSKTRIEQIDRLNELLKTKNAHAVFYKGKFIAPVESTRRTAFFADRRTYAYNTGKSETSLHYGIDYGVPTGTPVFACGDGKVVLVENRISTGWSVVIEHLPGIYSLYYHLDSVSVKEGTMIRQGEVFAKSGATGLATGPHLHWEIRVNGVAVNPDFFVENALF